MTDHYKVDNYLAANPGLLPLDVAATRSGSDSANYDLIERVSAGYIMNTFHLYHLSLQTGLRLEATHEYAVGYLVNSAAGPNGDGLDNNGNWIGTTQVTNTQTYIDPLPSIQARHAFTQAMAVRAVYARGISRPNQYDLVPYVSATGNNPVVASIGDPTELPTHANNYDLLLEQELKPFGLIQTGFFYKQLTNPIVTANVPCTGACLAVVPGTPAGSLVQEDANGTNAQVWGLEFGLQQRLTNLPSAFRGLGLMANYSYNDSNICAYQYYSTASGISECGSPNPNPADSAPLNGPINGPYGDNYFYPHFQVDAQMSARIYRGLQLQVEGLDLNNEDFGFYNGSPQYMTQREYYKPTYSVSLRWNSRREH